MQRWAHLSRTCSSALTPVRSCSLYEQGLCRAEINLTVSRLVQPLSLAIITSKYQGSRLYFPFCRLTISCLGQKRGWSPCSTTTGDLSDFHFNSLLPKESSCRQPWSHWTQRGLSEDYHLIQRTEWSQLCVMVLKRQWVYSFPPPQANYCLFSEQSASGNGLLSKTWHSPGLIWEQMFSPGKIKNNTRQQLFFANHTRLTALSTPWDLSQWSSSQSRLKSAWLLIMQEVIQLHASPLFISPDPFQTWYSPSL